MLLKSNGSLAPGDHAAEGRSKHAKSPLSSTALREKGNGAPGALSLGSVANIFNDEHCLYWKGKDTSYV